MIKSVVFLSFMLMLLTGCAPNYGDGLLSLPKLPGVYVQLQNKLDEILKTGAVYASADTGSYRQSVQLIDLDGDGNDEVVAFFQAQDGTYQIYAYHSVGENYEEIGKAEGYGATLHAVYYPQCGDSGQLAMAVSWGIDESTSYGMTVFGLTNDGFKTLLNLQYSSVLINSYNGDSVDELFFAVRDKNAADFTLKFYEYKDNKYELITQSPFCVEAKSVANMQLGKANGKTAIVVDSVATSGGYVTDLFTFSGKSLYNETLDYASGSGISTWRPISVLSTDIDGDGSIEVPVAAELKKNQSNADLRYKLDWCVFQEGKSTGLVGVTFHNVSEEWYIFWPEKWGSLVSATRRTLSNVTVTTFSVMPQANSIAYEEINPDLLSIYAFTGDSRLSYYTTQGVKILTESSTMVYGYNLHESSFPELALTDENVKQCFQRIEKKWISE